MRKILTAIGVFLAVPILAGDLGTYLETKFSEMKAIGASVCVVKGDKIAWSGCFGHANIETKRNITANTLFSVGSISKTITGTAIMQLYEQGQIKLDEDINSFLTFPVRNPHNPEKPITFRMLLTHTASISDRDVKKGENRLDVFNEQKDSKRSLKKILKGYLTPGGEYYKDGNFIKAVPGKKYEYSNLGYALIGLLVERISKQTFHEYCRKNIFGPLEMKETTWLIAELPKDNFAFQYEADPQNPQNLIKIRPYTWAGYMDGGLRTTAVEYSRFLSMFINGGRYGKVQILKPETVAAILENQDVILPPSRFLQNKGIGLTWHLKSFLEGTWIMHDGFGTGFFTIVYFNEKKKVGCILFLSIEMRQFFKSARFIGEIMEKLASY